MTADDPRLTQSKPDVKDGKRISAAAQKALSTIKIRKAIPSDFPVMDQISLPFNYDVGLHNLDCFYKVCNDWYVAEDANGEILAILAHNKLAEGVYSSWHTIVRKDKIKLGIPGLFPYIFDKKYNAIGNGNPIFIKSFALNRFTEKLHIYGGAVSADKIPSRVALPADIKVVDMAPEHIAAVCAYDKSITGGFKSSEFIENWARPAENPELARCLLALKDDGQVCGYAVLRQFTEFYGLMPCYADTQEIGQNLLAILGAHMLTLPFENMFITAMAKNMAAITFAKQMGLEFLYTEIMSFRIREDLYEEHFKGKIDYKRVFAIQEFFPL